MPKKKDEGPKPENAQPAAKPKEAKKKGPGTGATSLNVPVRKPW